MLSAKERLKKVLAHESVDRTPCICPGGMMNMVTRDLIDALGISFQEAHKDAKLMSELAAAVYDQGCFENYGVPFCMTIESEELGATVNFGTNIYEPHVVAYAIQSVTEWELLPKINFETGRAKVVLEAIRLLKEKDTDVPIIGNLTGPISTASSVMEPVVFYKALRKNNEAAHHFIEYVTDQLIEFARMQIRAGADVIAISDPSGTGEILGPKLFEEFVVKYINKLLSAIQEEGAGTIVHICGQMKNVYAEVDKIQSDALSFDSIVNIKEAREHLPNRILMGNVSTYAIEFADEKKVAELTLKCVVDSANIISPACGLGMKSPLSNVKSMLQALKKGDVSADAEDYSSRPK
jgi:MtaA/CmuA family methyltransferase